ncbi:MAG: Fur family transcriptional regulator [Anaerolineae bacterium]
MTDDLSAHLTKAGYRLTQPRRAVLEVLEAEGEHLKPHQVMERAQTLHPSVGRATVYRTLELLSRLGLIRPMYLGDLAPSFSRSAGGHHHVVCTNCGTAVEIEECAAEDLSAALSKRLGFRITSHLLEFAGLCADCQE